MAGLAVAKSQRHPAAPFVAVYMLVAIGRIPELFVQFQPLHLGKVSAALAVLALVVSKVKKNSLRQTTLAGPLMFIVVLGVLSVGFSVWGTGTVRFLQQDLVHVLAMFCLIYLSSINFETVRFYFRVLVGVLLIFVLLGVTTVSGARLEFTNRYDPNDIGLVVLIISAITFGVGWDKSTSNRWVMLLIAVMGAGIVLITQSRGAFVGLCAVGLYFSFSNVNGNSDRLYRRPEFRVLAAIGVATLLLVAAAPADVWERILTVFELESDYNTTADRGRIAIWERGLTNLASRPWGSGGGAFQVVDMHAGGVYQTAHNSFLQIGVELGVLGFIAFTLLLIRAWKVTSRVLRARGLSIESAEVAWIRALVSGLRGGIVAFSVTGFFLSMAYSRLLYAVLGIVAATEVLLTALSAAEKEQQHEGRSIDTS